jgi:hypothetical protein
LLGFLLLKISKVPALLPDLFQTKISIDFLFLTAF